MDRLATEIIFRYISQRFSYYERYICRASLWNPGTHSEVSNGLFGDLVTSAGLFKTEESKVLVTFPELSVTVEGRFELRFALYRLQDEGVGMHGSLIARAHSKSFNVYSRSAYPGNLGIGG